MFSRNAEPIPRPKGEHLWEMRRACPGVVHLNNLSRINVLVGENNSGKTSVLEAIQLMSNPFSELLLFNIALRRMGVVSIVASQKSAQLRELLKWIFPQYNDEHQSIKLRLQQADKQTTVSFELNEKEFIDSCF